MALLRGVSAFGEMTSPITFLEDRDDPCPCCEMSFNTRLIGALICSGVGMLLSVGSFIAAATGSLSTFAVIYSLGTLLALGGSFFVAGPKKHLEKLKCIAHSVSLAVICVAIICVFLAACQLGGTSGTILAIVFVIVQACALVVFTLTLNEVAWAGAKSLLGNCLKCCH